MSRIFQVTSWLSNAGGGIPPVIKSLVTEFRRQQLDCVIAGLADPVNRQSIFSPDRPVISGRIVGPAAFGFSPDLARQMRRIVNKESLMHVHGLWMYPGWLARKLAVGIRAPLIISPHGMLDPWALQNSRWKKRIAAWVFENENLRTANCLQALCESEAQGIRKLGIRTPIAIIPNGVELPAQKNINTMKTEDLKSQNGMPPWDGFVKSGQKVVLFLSRLHPKKGLANLLEAWQEAHNSGEWVLAIAGWDQGGHEAELKAIATRLGLGWADVRGTKTDIGAQPPVIFLGPQFNESKSSCYANCDGFVLPSFSEGLPVVVLEAWAHGKPVLMTPECNLPIGFARNAAIRIEANIQSIKHGLQEFFEMSEIQRRVIGENGLRLAREQFAWPRLAQEMRQVYDWLMGGGPRPGCVL